MKVYLFICFLFFSFLVSAQTICNADGNLIIYSNYDGGILTINIDQNIPNLKVGICTYVPIQVSFTGAFVGNITQVIYAGFNSIQNNNNCSQGNFITSVTGVPTGIISILTNPPVGYTPAHGNGSGTWGGGMIGAGQCDTLTDAGGVNTPDEIVYYFQQATGGQLLFHKTQYACWLNETIFTSAGGNCCIQPPNQCNLNASVAIIQNSICEPCSYSGPPILINELMISPNNGDGSISGSGGNGEWIELYNPDLCDSVDISCYYLGNSTAEGTGGFRLPAGTIIPPNGFAMIRGENAAPVPSNVLLANGGNVVEIVVPIQITGPGVCCSGTRVWFPNAGGWFAFYDAVGNPIDAVSWAGNAATLAGNPCISNSNSCSSASSLASYNAIPSNLKFYASPLNGGDHMGQSIRRFPDGGNWQGVGSPTYAVCNDPTNCLTGTSIGFCNGQGTVTTTSGVAPFTYQWNDDLNQTTQTATNLCEGSYQVIVTDANNCSDTVLVNIITTPFNLSTNIQQPGCQLSNGSISIDPFDPSYSYTWTPNVSNTNVANNLPQGTYNIYITQGFCFLDTTIILQNPVPFETNFQIQQTICGEDNGSIMIDNVPNSSVYFYNWSPAISTTNSAVGIAPGSYQISITDNFCVFDTTITIQTSLGINSSAQVTNSTCELNNGSISLQIFPPSNYTFSWTPSVSSSSIGQNLLAGSYTISYTDGLCSNDTVINILTTPLPSSIQSSFSNPYCGLENGVLLIGGTNGGTAPYSYFFNGLPVQINDSIQNIGIGNYPISVVDANGCSLTQTSSFIMTSGISDIFIPNVLTANNDQANDLWKINATCIDAIKCEIFNRWGNKIYEFDNLSEGWVGKTFGGNEAEEGVYFYKVTFDFFGDEKDDEIFQGHITLIR